MAFTYTAGGTGTSLVRLLLADTNSSRYAFEDAELQAFLDLEDADSRLAAAPGLRTLAVDAAKRAVWYQINGLMMDRRVVPKLLLDEADKLEARVMSTPFEFESVLDSVIDYAGVDRSQYAVDRETID